MEIQLSLSIVSKVKTCQQRIFNRLFALKNKFNFFINQKIKIMEKKKNFLFSSALIAGAITATGSLNANTNLLEFEDLGTGGELRSALLNNDRPMPAALELNCGEKKSKEGKCGEGKKEEGKKAKKKESKSSEHKCGEGKCGEGKCGEKKKEEGKKSKKTEQKPEL